MIRRVRSLIKQDPDGVVVVAVVSLMAVVLALGFVFKLPIA